MRPSRRDVIWGLVGVVIGMFFIWGGLTASVEPDWQLGRQYGLWVAFAGVTAAAASLLTLIRPILGGRSTVAAAVGATLSVMLAMPWAWFVVLPVTITLGFVGARRLRVAPAG